MSVSFFRSGIEATKAKTKEQYKHKENVYGKKYKELGGEKRILIEFENCTHFRERGARALEERLAAERLAAARSAQESGKDATENV